MKTKKKWIGDMNRKEIYKYVFRNEIKDNMRGLLGWV